MESKEFIEYCKEKFEYLILEHGFKTTEENDEVKKQSILFEKKDFKIRMNFHVIEIPSFPISIDLNATEKKLFGKFLNQEKKL